MKRKNTYISKNQLLKYGFSINPNRKTDLEATRTIDSIGEIRIFNYDYYTIRPDLVLMIDINSERVFEKKVRNRQRFQKVMKTFKINRV